MADSTHSSSYSELPSDSSTKTSSSGDLHSQQVALEEPQAKDDGFSPVDMECHIQAERVTKSLDKMVYLTKLTLCLPALIEKNILSNTLSDQHFNDVCYVYDLHNMPVSSHSLLNMTAVEDMQAGDMSIKHRLNPEMSCILHILNSYTALRPYVEKLTEQMKKDFATNANRGDGDGGMNMSHTKEPPAGLAYLLKLEDFRHQMVLRMSTTAAEQFTAIIKTRKLERSNNESVEKINEYTKCLIEEKQDMEDQMRQKTKLIAQLKQQLVVFHHRSEIIRRKQILDSERQMVLAKRAHVVKYQMLKEEEAESQDVYEKAINQNLRAEKHLRDRRRKVETQLQSWLQKYDVEMTEKQSDLDGITKQYEDEEKKVNELKDKLNEQNIEFDKLMAEREGEYHQEMKAKLEEFIIEHAAKVIQHAWRQTTKNRAEKSKLLKLKWKQEMEREAAARRAELEAKKQALEEKKRAAQEKREAKAAAKAGKLAPKTGQEPEG